MELARWTAHPARRRPQDVALVAAVVLLSSGAVLASFESLFLAALAAVILIVAVAPFLFPSHYVLSDAGVAETRGFRRKYRAWSDLRRVQIGRDGALVSPFRTKNWLDRYRGMVILFDGADRAEIAAILRERISAPASVDESTANPGVAP